MCSATVTERYEEKSKIKTKKSAKKLLKAHNKYRLTI